MALPELTRRQLERQLSEFCDKRVPAFARHQVRLEYEIRGNSATIVERRVPYRPISPDEPWTRLAVAQLRFDTAQRNWTLYWRDRDERWHLYELIDPSPTISELLNEIERDPTAIFWG